MGCRACAPQIKRLWERVGKDCEWESPRAPAVRLLWDVRAMEAVVEFLEITRVGCRTASRVGKDREWESPRAPAVRLLWDVRAVEAVVEFPEITRVGCRIASRVLGAREVEG